MRIFSGLKSVFLWGAMLMIMGNCQLSSKAYAEDVLELGEVVVTATRVERLITDIPASVTVITREEIEKTYAKTVEDFLEREVGIDVRQWRGLTYGAGINMRGTGGWGTRTLVLKDGIPMNTQVFGGQFMLLEMAVQDVERIEIVRGPASAIYGSAALGGVINIITRRADPGFSGNVSTEAGSFDRGIGSLGLRYGAENFGLRFTAERKQTGGYEYRDPWDPDNIGWRLPDVEVDHISLGGDLWLGESLLSVDFDHFGKDSATGRTTHWYGIRETNKYRVGWETPLFGFGEETVFSLTGYYSGVERPGRSYRFNPATGEFDPRDRTIRHSSDYGIMSQISTVLGNHHLVAGVDLRGANIEHRQYFPLPGRDRKFEGEQRLYGVFVNNEMHLGDRVILSAGLRYDHWENVDGRFYDPRLGVWKEYPTATDSAISPRGGIVYKLTPNTRLRASVGTGFRAPPLWHTFRAGPGHRHYDIGNPELKPERLDWSYDIGVDMQPHENLNLSLTFYQSQFSDFIDRIDLDPADPRVPYWVDSGGLPVRKRINVGEVNIHGVEAELDFRFNERWSAFINHTFNVSEIGEFELDPAFEGNYLPWQPRHASAVGFTYVNPELFTLNLTIESKGPRYTRKKNDRPVDGFHMVNMRASRELFEGTEIFVNAENLTDEIRKETRLSIAPPFNFLIGARHTF